MSATDDIRVLLGEHGVKCEIHDTKKRKDTLWDFCESSHAMFSEYRDGMTVFVMSGALWTPAQAIAATLGRGTCKPTTYDNYLTKRLKPGEYYEFWEPACMCSECGELIPMRRFCPNCGRRVVDK